MGELHPRFPVSPHVCLASSHRGSEVDRRVLSWARMPPEQEARLMAGQTKRRSDLTLVPEILHESLYIGIDVGKYQHVAGFVSTTLLERHERFEGCPVLAFEQSRQGFRSLASAYACLCASRTSIRAA